MIRVKKVSNPTRDKQKRKTILIVITIVIALILLVIFVAKGFSALLENDVEVKPDTELIYYLNVSYDGVDRNGTRSSSSRVAEINSDTIFVEDKIPDGLTFKGFVTTSDGSIGAVRRNTSTTCLGKVVDDTNEEAVDTGTWISNTEYVYHGLHYDATTRTVSFKVKNIKAGCELVVGIKTQTPSTIDDPETQVVETRRDFYNFATARERGLTINSNTVHAFMGDEFATEYNVSYAYSGTIPDNAPELPQTTGRTAGSKVGVAPDVKLEGYTFSGWTTLNAVISNGTFTMPTTNVVLAGTFTEIPTKKVSYELTGETPEGYVLPSEKNYYPASTVKVDSLKSGDVFNDYRFRGWTSSDVTIDNDGEFTMPSRNVTVQGEFEPVKYNVIYQFYDGVLPPNANNYLPATTSYSPGATVQLADVVSEPSGYKFLGWYKESEFEMPEHDVVVYGEWKVQTGLFQPTITKTINNAKPYYRVGDTVELKTTVTNTAEFSITNVIVKENTEKAVFTAGTGYSVLSDHVANIDTIAANSSIDLYSTYVITNEQGTITTESEIKGALASNNYELFDKEYKATASFGIQSKLTVCSEITGNYDENRIQFRVTGNTNNYETWIVLEKDACETIFVDPGTYKIKEVVPQEYTIKSVTGAVNADNTNLVIASGQDYTVTYTNEFIKKGFFHSYGKIINRVVQGGN